MTDRGVSSLVLVEGAAEYEGELVSFVTDWTCVPCPMLSPRNPPSATSCRQN